VSKAILRLSSITYAIRAQKLLDLHGIRSYMRKVPGAAGDTSCSYGLEISDDPSSAQYLLNGAGIRVLDIQQG
jgi:hypothetical protein